MTAAIFEILATQFAPYFLDYAISNIVDGVIESGFDIPTDVKEEILTFYAQLENPTLVVEKYKPIQVGEVKIEFLTSIIDGNPYFTSINFNGAEMIIMTTDKQEKFIAWLKSGIEKFSADETDVNDF